MHCIIFREVKHRVQLYTIDGWKMAHLPTITPNNIQIRIEKLITEYLKLMKYEGCQQTKSEEHQG